MRMFAAILGLFLVPQSSSPLLSGRIVDSNGHAVPDVAVLSQLFNPTGGYSTVKTHTNPDGQFSLAADGKVVFVRKAGFVPFTHVLARDERQVQLVLEPLSQLKTLHVAGCWDTYGVNRQVLSSHKFNPKGVTLYGEAHLYPVPNNAAVEHQSDVDYGAHIVSSPKGRKNRMFIYWGFSYIGDYPNVHLFDNVVAFTERALSTAEDTEEIKGTLKNGHKFRWVGASLGSVFYHDVTPQAAEYFDRIIDQGCVLD
ncbi:MAG TPA: carboxypeptidase-like regulatory domain-containing protein [Candidatus Angelobacter sp.]